MSIERSKRIKLLRSAFGLGSLESSGKNIAFWCPNCKESKRDKKKLVVHLETGWYHCWVCNLSGKNPVYLFRKFAKKYVDKCVEVFDCRPIGSKTPADDVDTQQLDFPDDARLVVESRDPDAREVFSYLKKRGMSTLDMYRWRVCFSNEFRLRRRAIFPSFDIDGKVNYYVARSIDDSFYKYNNAKVPKSSIIFNEVDIDWSQPVILVEGIFDAVKCPDNTVPVLGSSLPKKSLLFKMLSRNQSTVIVAFDEDAEMKAHRVCSILSKAGCDVFKTDILDGDLGSRSKTSALEALTTARRWSPDSRISYKISSIKSGSVL